MTEDNRLSKWSKRKLEARAGLPHAEEEPRNSPPLAAEGGIEQSHLPDAEDDRPIPEDLEGIDLETVGEEFDFSRLMQADVPAHLKRIGLRRLWRTNPLYALRDGMNDYDEDYTDAAMGVKEMKGFFEIAMAKQAEAKKQAAALAEQLDNISERNPPPAEGQAQQPSGAPGEEVAPLEATASDQPIAETIPETNTAEPSPAAPLDDNTIFKETTPQNTAILAEEEVGNEPPQEPQLNILSRHGWLPI